MITSDRKCDRIIVPIDYTAIRIIPNANENGKSS